MISAALAPRSFSRATLTGGLLALVALLGGCINSSLNFKKVASESLSAPAPGQLLTIRNDVGTITVRADPTASSVSVEVEKVGKGSSQVEADKALDEIVVSLAPHPSNQGELEGFVTHPRGMRRRGYEVNWVVTAPPTLALRLQTDVGEIEAHGFQAGGRFRTDVGNIAVTDFVGPVDAKSDVGDVRVSTSGAITIRTDVGDVVAHATGAESHSVAVSTDVGAVVLHLDPNWSGKVVAATDVGSVTLATQTAVREEKRTKHRFEGKIGEASTQASIEITSDVGSITIAGPSPVGADPNTGAQQQ